MNDAYEQVPEQPYYDGPSQVQRPIRQETRLLGFAMCPYILTKTNNSRITNNYQAVQLTTGEPRDPLCLQLYMEDVA